jgi:hypothetical protein
VVFTVVVVLGRVVDDTLELFCWLCAKAATGITKPTFAAITTTAIPRVSDFFM